MPSYNTEVINSIKHYIVENERTARRCLIAMGIKTAINDLEFFVLNKHTDVNEIASFLKPAAEHPIGLLSEAGVPAVADPGGEIVALAHQQGIRVVPLVGPSSILLALMASGLNGQNFAFLGYLPVKGGERIRKIREIEQTSQKLNQTQAFIEAPYRNNQMLEDLATHCSPNTQVCVAANITTSEEFIQTRPAKAWKKNKPDLHKKPVIFLILRK